MRLKIWGICKNMDILKNIWDILKKCDIFENATIFGTITKIIQGHLYRAIIQ